MKSIRPSVIITGISLASLSLGVMVGIQPQLTALNQARAEIDTTRLTIASLEKQQANLETVQREFTALQAAERSLQARYVQTKQSIDLFNTIDELFAQTRVSDGQLRLDSPSPNAEHQLTGAHLTFSATYAELITFIRQLNTIEPLVRIQSLAITGADTGDQLTVTIDAAIPWRQSL